MPKAAILSVLETGNVSIVATFRFDILPNGKKTCEPILYLRARNEDREVIDLFSYKKRCSMLRSDGCEYSLEERPSGAVYLIPKEDYHCTSIVDREEELLKWMSYQRVLARIVKQYTKKSVEAVLKENIEEVLVETFHKAVKGIEAREDLALVSGLADVVECFPACYERALERSKDIPKIVEEIVKRKVLHIPLKK